MKYYEANNPADRAELTNERDALWFMRALRGDFGSYSFEGPYGESGDPFMVAVPATVAP